MCFPLLTSIVRSSNTLEAPFRPGKRTFATVAAEFSSSPKISNQAHIKKSMEIRQPEFDTQIIPTDATQIGKVTTTHDGPSALEDWSIDWQFSPSVANLRRAAQQIRESDIPVAFPTETVYGLGADATRSNAVRGIFKAKNRPVDNPLIVHVDSLRMLRRLLRNPTNPSGDLPPIYTPLIQRFWPGPLTILLPVPSNPSISLAPEVTAGLQTFGVRIPRHILALALIKLANVPMAAPSANASTKPSPTTAEHVLTDLAGRIDTIIDGGPCAVGVESTVVDGLCDPPAVLRPGGISVEQLRECEGWEGVVVGYRDAALEMGVPRAPGMKYRHYSPRAKVVLFEAGVEQPEGFGVLEGLRGGDKVGVVRTMRWVSLRGCGCCGGEDGETKALEKTGTNGHVQANEVKGRAETSGHADTHDNTLSNLLSSLPPVTQLTPHEFTYAPASSQGPANNIDVVELALGTTPEAIARGLFAALRMLDQMGCTHILLEGIDDGLGELSAAVMNRVRKAAERVVR